MVTAMNGASTSHRALRPAALAALAGAALLLAGCAGGTLSPSADDAARVAQEFSAAVAAGRGADACALLVPAAQDRAAELAAPTGGGGCAAGVVALGLPDSGQVLHQQASGRAAFVELENDTVFLAVSGSAWRVRAAGCVEQGDAPFDCVLEGS
jgi:hypothetical protein